VTVTAHRDLELQADIFTSLLRIYEKFLIGTRVCEIVEVKDYDHLQTLAQVASNYPLSLQELREVNNDTYIADSLRYARTQADREILFDKYLKVNKSAPKSLVMY
jgi:hypothetical protein